MIARAIAHHTRVMKVAIVLVGLVLLSARSARADDPAASLEVTRSADAADCPDASALAALVARERGRDSLVTAAVAGATLGLEVAFARSSSGYVATVRSTGDRTGTRTIADQGPSCSALAVAVVVTLTVMLDESAPAAAPPKASQAAFKAAHELARPSEPGSDPVSAPALAFTPEAPKPGQTQRVVGLAIGVVGLAGIVTGVVTAVMAKSASDKTAAMCPNHLCAPAGLSQYNSAQHLASASDISLIAGGVALGAGAIVFFTAPTSKTVVGMGPATEGAGLSVAGRF